MGDVEIETTFVPGAQLVLNGLRGDYEIHERTDGRNLITLRVTSNLASERWRFVHMRGSKLTAIAHVTDAEEARALAAGRITRVSGALIILVPPGGRSAVHVQVNKGR